MDNKDLSFTTHKISSFVLGNRIFPGAVIVRGRTFVFTPRQEAFLLELHKLKNIHAASLSVGWTEEFAEKFLDSRKFTIYRTLKLEEAKVKAGINTDMLLQVAQWNLDGKKVWWDAICTKCAYQDEWTDYQVEACRTDDYDLKPTCPFCFEPVTLQKQEKPFVMSREQMDMWKEAASRFWPKVERISHQFSKEEVVFETDAS